MKYLSEIKIVSNTNNKTDKEKQSFEKYSSNKGNVISDENLLVVNSPNDLCNFLKEEALNHKEFHHYTTFESLKLILTNKTFKMTRGISHKLNDLHEPKEKGEYDTWERTYMSCFNYSDEENMAMWGLYGRPSNEAVRITIPKDTFIKLCKSNCKVLSNDEIIDNNIIDIFATDIFYTKCNNKKRDKDPAFQEHNGRKIKFKIKEKLFNYLKNAEFTGCVKSHSWHYEDEVRIIARLKKGYVYSDDFILLNIPEECLKTFKITTGPNFTKKEELYKLLRPLKIKSTYSLLENMINFKKFF